MQKQRILFTFLLFTSSFLFAQPLVDWAKNFGGNSSDVGLSIIPTSDGGYIAFGQTNSNNGDFPLGAGLADFGALKLNGAGQAQWSRKYGGNHVDNGFYIHPTSDGGYILCGSTQSSNGDFPVNKGNFDFGVVKIDANGTKQWSNTYGGSGEDNPFCVKQTADGGYIVCGLSNSTNGDFSQNNGGAYDYALVRLDGNGNLIWAKNFGGSGDDQAKFVEVTSDGSFIICGYSNSSNGDFNQNNGNYDYGVIKVADSGTKQWAINYGGSLTDKGACIRQTNDGGYIMLGEAFSSNGAFSQNNGGFDYGVIKIASTGAIEWAKNYGGTSSDLGSYINFTNDGNYVLVGTSISANGDFLQNNGLQDYGVLKISTTGTKIWSRNYGGTNTDIPISIFPTADGGFIINGYSESSNGDFSQQNGIGDYGVIKLSGFDCSTLNINLNATPVAATCATSKDGKINLSTNVSSIKNYLWTASFQSGSGNSSVITTLDPGVYNVTVTLQNGCSATASNITVTSGSIALNANPISPTCLGGANGRILLSAPPTGIQLYVWSNGTTTNAANGSTINNLSAGTYSITVNLTNNCVAYANNVVLQPGVQHSITATPTAPICSGSNGSLTINSDAAILSYIWVRGTQSGSGTSGNVGSLPVGTYQVTVTHSTGCKSSTTVTIPSTAPINSSANNSPPLCQGKNDGSITLNSSEPITTYNWSNGTSSGSGSGSVISNLLSGTYVVTITHANSCKTTVTTTIAQGASTPLSATPTTPTCANIIDGSINLSASATVSTFIWSNGSTTVNGSGSAITNLAAGTYNITATLSNGCIAIGAATISAAQAPTLVGLPTKPSCLGKNDASIGLSSNNPISSFVWSNGSSTMNGVGGSIDNLSPGSYGITATLSNGCIAKTTVVIQAGDAPQIIATPTSPSCTGKNDASIALSSNAGAVVSYLWVKGASNNSGTGNNISNLSTGVYFITATLVNGCTGTQLVNITPGNVPLLTATPTKPSCLGKEDASLALSSIDAIATYNWIGNNTNGSGIGSNITNLKSGTYSVTATLANGCITSTVITIQAGSQILAIGTPLAPSCLGKNDGSIILNAADPIGTYNWEKVTGGLGNGTGSVINSLSPGTYNISITLANGCLATTTVTIPAAQALNLNAIPSKPSCFGNNDGSIALSASETIAGFQWLNIVKNGNGNGSTINGLSSGYYSITATLSNGCLAVANNVFIDVGNTIPLSAMPTAPSCLGGKDGNISLSANNTITNYSWASTFGASFGSSSNISNLQSGVYNVTATLVNGCVTIANNVIVPFGTPLNLNTSPQSPSCLGRSDGSIQLSSIANVANYTWSSSSSSKMGTGNSIGTLPAGTYNISATLVNGCIANASNIVINNGTPINANTTTLAPTCLGKNDGKINIINNPQAISFIWSNGTTTGSGNSNSINSLASGTYQVTATLSDKCIAIAKDVKIQDGQIFALNVSPTHPTCAGKDGALALQVANQNIQNFQWQSGANTGDGNNGTINGLSSGTYNITATLANGCISVGSAILNTPANATINLTSSTPTCPRGTNGKIILDPLSNSITTYTWSNGTITKNGNSTTIDSLSAGNYSISVTLSNGCEVVSTIKVEEQAAFIPQSNVIPSSCSGNDGKITLSGNGFSILSYNWESQGNTQLGNGNEINQLNQGEYSITATLSNGCSANITVTIPLDNIFNVNAITTPPSCENKADGTILLNSLQTIQQYVWAKDSLSGKELNSLYSGIYAITVTSKAGCETVLSNVIVPTGKIFSASATLISPSCEGKSDGKITLNGSDPINKYLWSNNITTGSSLNNLAAGTYNITVTSNSGCETILKDIILPDGTVFSVSATTTSPTCDDKSDASIGITSVNDISTYFWQSGSQSGATLNNLKSGTYNLTVTSKGGCEAILQNIVIPKGEVFDLSYSTISPKCFGEQGTVALSSNNTNGVTYQWTNGIEVGSGTGLMINNLKSGNYQITASLNGTGCVKVENVKLAEPQLLTLNLIKSNTSCKGNDGAVLPNAGGGTPPFKYQWNDGSFEEKRNNLVAGDYALTLTDANGCSMIRSANIQSVSSSFKMIDTLICEGNNLKIGAKTFDKEGKYTETLINGKGCDSIITLNLRLDKFDFDLGKDVEICPTQSIELKANTNCINCQLKWNNGASDNTIKVSPQSTSTYSLTITNVNGCLQKDEIKVLVTNIAPFAANDDIFSIAQGNEIDLDIIKNDKYTNANDFIWQLLKPAQSGEVAIKNNNQANFIPNAQNAQYQSDTFSYVMCNRICTNICDSAKMILNYKKEECSRELFNGLTAELNGQNDSFSPIADLQQNGCDVAEASAKMRIINPWGDVIFKPTKYQEWFPTKSGNSGDATLPAGTYYYILEVSINGRREILKGTVVVLE